MHRIFAYGTLQREWCPSHLLPWISAWGSRQTRLVPFELWDIQGHFPVVIPSDHLNPLTGTMVYLANLKTVDGYEHGYTRTQILLPDGPAWLYVANESSHGLKQIWKASKRETGLWLPRLDTASV